MIDAQGIKEKIEQLIAQTSSSLSDDVEEALRAAKEREERGSSAELTLGAILRNIELARSSCTPLCQDTGTLTFFVDERLRALATREVIEAATAAATERGLLRKNCIDSISGKSYDENVALGAPNIHYMECVDETKAPRITLLMKGGGSENMSRQYSLPDEEIGAGRDLKGVEKCILDAVVKAQGYGCAPGVLGVCIGGDRATGYEIAKEQLLRPLQDEANDAKIAAMEKSILEKANSLGIGPMGLGGKTTLLGVKIAARPRVPASFFVTIAYMCWATRRRTIEIKL